MRTLIALCLAAVMVLGPLTAPAEAGHKFGTGFAAGAATVLFLHHLSHQPLGAEDQHPAHLNDHAEVLLTIRSTTSWTA